jgi:hypothetical protein
MRTERWVYQCATLALFIYSPSLCRTGALSLNAGTHRRLTHIQRSLNDRKLLLETPQFVGPLGDSKMGSLDHEFRFCFPEVYHDATRVPPFF